ncbi:C6 zinc finger domain protein, partial [Colletotrichum musicola]
MPSAVCKYGGSEINFFMPRTPGAAWAKPSEMAASAPKNAKPGPQILTFALQKRPRATRASVPKVRTGCISCESFFRMIQRDSMRKFTNDRRLVAGKRRHVKCDEAKPSCQRCVKWRGFCEGYETSSSARSTPVLEPDARSTTPTKGLVVKIEDTSSEAYSFINYNSETILAEPTTNLFENETERQYFDHWLQYRNRLGGGFFDEQLWNETIPQLSRQHTSVRYAIMAIGGIAQATRHSLKSTSPVQMGANGPHYHLALSYYGRAIREVREAKLDTSSLRGAIVCCLLFICFEVLHGDRKAAFSHLNNGQRMMDELLRSSEQGYNVLGADSFERDILHVFQRLIQQSWSCGVLRRRDQFLADACSDLSGDDSKSDQSWCCRGGSGGKCAIHHMPSSFATLQDARCWWDVTQHYVTHSSDIVLRVTHLGLEDDFLSECNERVQRHLDDIAKARAGARPTMSEQWQDFKDALERWHTGFEPLWMAAQESKDEDERSYAQAAHLRAHYLTLYGCVHCPLSCSYDSIAQLTPKYREVVELCGYLLEYQQRSLKPCEVFTMDMGPTWPLFLAGTRCRDAEVRNEAIRLLHEHPRRDGLWDSRIFYALT